jgi:hypothetical protein
VQVLFGRCPWKPLFARRVQAVARCLGGVGEAEGRDQGPEALDSGFCWSASDGARREVVCQAGVLVRMPAAAGIEPQTQDQAPAGPRFGGRFGQRPPPVRRLPVLQADRDQPPQGSALDHRHGPPGQLRRDPLPRVRLRRIREGHDNPLRVLGVDRASGTRDRPRDFGPAAALDPWRHTWSRRNIGLKAAARRATPAVVRRAQWAEHWPTEQQASLVHARRRRRPCVRQPPRALKAGVIPGERFQQGHRARGFGGMVRVASGVGRTAVGGNAVLVPLLVRGVPRREPGGWQVQGPPHRPGDRRAHQPPHDQAVPLQRSARGLIVEPRRLQDALRHLGAWLGRGSPHQSAVGEPLGGQEPSEAYVPPHSPWHLGVANQPGERRQRVVA